MNIVVKFMSSFYLFYDNRMKVNEIRTCIFRLFLPPPFTVIMCNEKMMKIEQCMVLRHNFHFIFIKHIACVIAKGKFHPVDVDAFVVDVTFDDIDKGEIFLLHRYCRGK